MHSNNGTKSTPSLSGDWREEVIWPTSDNTRDKDEFDGPDNPCLGIDDTVQTIFYGKPHNGFILCLAEN